MRARGIAGGAYASKQIFSRNRLVAWSHGSRFATAAALVGAAAGGRLLDYGCGDGTFVAIVNERFESATGTDADARQLADCRERFRDLHHVLFLPQDLVDNDPRHVAAYDVVTCMEVLEHCLDETRRQVIGQLRRLVKPSGRVVVSVPIETGLSLPAKQVARRVAGWRGTGDYRHAERYSWAELFRMTCAGATTRIRRPVYGADGTPAEEPYRFHGHKGFNWRIVEREIAAVLDITERRHSPMPALGTVLNSQVWMVCRPR